MGHKSGCVIGCKDAIDMQGCHKNIFGCHKQSYDNFITNYLIVMLSPRITSMLRKNLEN